MGKGFTESEKVIIKDKLKKAAEKSSHKDRHQKNLCR